MRRHAWLVRRGAACRRSSRWSTTRARLRARLDGAPAARGRGGTHHAAHRLAFGRRLSEQPLMQNVLADLCLESEAATLTGSAWRAPSTRATTPSVASPPQSPSTGSARSPRAWSARRSSASRATATSRSRAWPRLYRESPLNSIWEGAGNVCLDVLRALARSPESLDAYVAEVSLAEDPGVDRVLDEGRAELEHVDESRARYLVERLALALQASLLLRHGDPAVAEAFCGTRLEGGGGRRSARCPGVSSWGGSSSGTGRSQPSPDVRSATPRPVAAAALLEPFSSRLLLRDKRGRAGTA